MKGKQYIQLSERRPNHIRTVSKTYGKNKEYTKIMDYRLKKGLIEMI